MKENVVTISDLIKNVEQLYDDPRAIEEIKKAYQYIADRYRDEKRLNGEEYVTHPLHVALILTSFNVDYYTIVAALLHDVLIDFDVKIEEITELFGDEVGKLVQSITKINKLSFRTDNDQLINYYRKIVVGLCEDVRVIFIKLAEKLHNMRTLWALPPQKQKEKALEALEILAPIAHRLGMYNLKSELEDLSLRYSKPDVYFDIVKTLNNTKVERDNAIILMKEKINKMLDANKIEHEIKGRSKSIYSIYNKLQHGRPFSDIYDILALRIYVETIPECYLTLGLIHSKYKPVPKRFKDYIAMPKENMYQSLHTTIFGEGGHLFEIQIRTYDMDKIAEYGLASHWSYKEKSGMEKMKSVMEQKLELFRSLIENEDTDTKHFMDSVKQEILDKNIYVFTPKGDVVELPLHSTPIDFAFRVHSEVGEKMIGAIVNDVIVPLDYPLKGGEIVKINTSKTSLGPKREWLTMVKTSQARNKIKAFFTKIERDEFILKGEELLNKELKKNKLSTVEFFTEGHMERLLKEFDIKDRNDLFHQIGNGKYNAGMFIHSLFASSQTKEELILDKLLTSSLMKKENKNDILVSGIDDIKATLASCCYPVKGDEIIGYITRGQGIRVHRSFCHNITSTEERIVDVLWNNDLNHKYPTRITVTALKRDNLLLDIVAKATNSKTSVQSVNTYNNNHEQIVLELMVLVENKDQLLKCMKDIKNISDVLEVERVLQ